MSFSGNTPIHLINQPQTLQQCLQELERCDTLSVDIEFDNNSYGYGVTLCVIQVATHKACYVIDGLANLDLGGLYTLFESGGIQKIVHAPGEDLRLLHSLGCCPKNLFDTEVAARLLNYEATSLTVLLREKLNVTMDKKQQRSNWLRRPLTEAQVRYAAEDVIWLHPLKAVLEAEAREKGLLSFVQEEQELLSTTIYPAVAKTDFLKPSDQYTLSPREQFITNELLTYINEVARSINRPAYQVMREELVRELAAGTRQPESIVQEPGVHPRFKNSHFAARIAKHLEQTRKAAAAAQNLSPDKQHRSKPTPAEWAAIRRAEADRQQVFAPIQQALAERFGPHAAKLLLSNRMANNLLNGSTTLQELPAYRQKLIRSIAAAAGIDLSYYENRTERG